MLFLGLPMGDTVSPNGLPPAITLLEWGWCVLGCCFVLDVFDVDGGRPQIYWKRTGICLGLVVSMDSSLSFDVAVDILGAFRWLGHKAIYKVTYAESKGEFDYYRFSETLFILTTSGSIGTSRESDSFSQYA